MGPRQRGHVSEKSCRQPLLVLSITCQGPRVADPVELNCGSVNNTAVSLTFQIQVIMALTSVCKFDKARNSARISERYRDI